MTAVQLPYRGYTVHCSARDLAIYFHPNRTGAIDVLVFARPMALHARSEREIHREHRSVLAKLRLNIEGESMLVAEKSSHFETPH